MSKAIAAALFTLLPVALALPELLSIAATLAGRI